MLRRRQNDRLQTGPADVSVSSLFHYPFCGWKILNWAIFNSQHFALIRDKIKWRPSLVSGEQLRDIVYTIDFCIASLNPMSVAAASLK